MATIEAILLLLHDENADIRRSALEALRNAGEAAAAHIGAILPLLQDENDDVRRTAVEALRSTGEAVAAHIEPILPLLQHGNCNQLASGHCRRQICPHGLPRRKAALHKREYCRILTACNECDNCQST